jgi:hypothetical protein
MSTRCRVSFSEESFEELEFGCERRMDVEENELEDEGDEDRISDSYEAYSDSEEEEDPWEKASRILSVSYCPPKLTAR